MKEEQINQLLSVISIETNCPIEKIIEPITQLMNGGLQSIVKESLIDINVNGRLGRNYSSIFQEEYRSAVDVTTGYLSERFRDKMIEISDSILKRLDVLYIELDEKEFLTKARKVSDLISKYVDESKIDEKNYGYDHILDDAEEYHYRSPYSSELSWLYGLLYHNLETLVDNIRFTYPIESINNTGEQTENVDKVSSENHVDDLKPKLEWNATKTDFVEIVKALIENKAIRGGTQAEIFNILKDLFGLDFNEADPLKSLKNKKDKENFFTYKLNEQIHKWIEIRDEKNRQNR